LGKVAHFSGSEWSSISIAFTVLVAGRTLFRASSKVSLAFSILSSRPARTVPPRFWFVDLDDDAAPLFQGKLYQAFHLSSVSRGAFRPLPVHESRKLSWHILLHPHEECEQVYLQGSEQVAEEERWECQV
jgi:hypothetical protein